MEEFGFSSAEAALMDVDGDDEVTTDEWMKFKSKYNKFDTITGGSDTFDFATGLEHKLSQWFLEFLDEDSDGTITWPNWIRAITFENEFDEIREGYGAVKMAKFSDENTFDDWSVWYDTSNDDRIDWEEYYAGITDKAEWKRINNEATFGITEAEEAGYTLSDFTIWLDIDGNAEVDHDEFFAAMIVKNGFEFEYTTLLDAATYLTKEQWIASEGNELVFAWMDVDGDHVVSWDEFLEAKIKLITFNSLMVDDVYTADNLNTAAYGSLTDSDDAYYFYDMDHDNFITETEYITNIMGEIKFNILSEDEDTIPVGKAFQDFDEEYSYKNLTINWFDVNGDGKITLDEYKATLGQKQRWTLEYIDLRSYEPELTYYQWTVSQGRSEADWTWMNKQDGETISQSEYIQAKIELEAFKRVDSDNNEEVTVEAW
jgi:hypothetical protein